jgi:hypothetical protein
MKFWDDSGNRVAVILTSAVTFVAVLVSVQAGDPIVPILETVAVAALIGWLTLSIRTRFLPPKGGTDSEKELPPRKVRARSRMKFWNDSGNRVAVTLAGAATCLVVVVMIQEGDPILPILELVGIVALVGWVTLSLRARFATEDETDSETDTPPRKSSPRAIFFGIVAVVALLVSTPQVLGPAAVKDPGAAVGGILTALFFAYLSIREWKKMKAESTPAKTSGAPPMQTRASDLRTFRARAVTFGMLAAGVLWISLGQLIIPEQAKYRQTAWIGILLALAFAYMAFRDWRKMKAESVGANTTPSNPMQQAGAHLGSHESYRLASLFFRCCSLPAISAASSRPFMITTSGSDLALWRSGCRSLRTSAFANSTA